MRTEFDNHEEALAWITANAINESELMILQEELTFNHIDTGEYFVQTF